MIKNKLIFFVCLMMSSCLSWSEEELGDGYYYLPYYEAIDVGYNDGSVVYKSTQKLYFQTILIQGGIIEVKKDEKYILIGQNKQQHDLDYETKVYYYWIINKHSSSVYGPYTLDKYLAKKKELDVPESLKLKSEK